MHESYAEISHLILRTHTFGKVQRPATVIGNRWMKPENSPAKSHRCSETKNGILFAAAWIS